LLSAVIVGQELEQSKQQDDGVERHGILLCTFPNGIQFNDVHVDKCNLT
jgi:hypothetical protein